MKKAGLDVLLIDREKFPRDKPCGAGQVSTIFPLLEEMGVADEVDAYGFKCYGCTISDNREKIVNFRTPEEFQYITPRRIFDDIINKAAVNTGIDYMEEVEAKEIILRNGTACGVRAVFQGELIDLEADLVVIANGANSRLSRQMGFLEDNPNNLFYGVRGYFENVGDLQSCIEFHYPHPMFSPAGYIWIFPMREDRANVGVFIKKDSLKKTGMKIQDLLWWWRDNTPLGRKRLGNAVCISEMKGGLLPTGMHREIIGNGVIAVGDAGNMIEPLYGGGIPYAMMAGRLAAQSAQQAVAAGDFSKKMLENYKNEVNEVLGPEYGMLEYLRNTVFTDWKDLNEFLDYGAENFVDKGISIDAGDVMARFAVEKRGYTASTKCAYSK